MSYWANFAKNGNPNGDGNPIWPAYNLTTEFLNDLAFEFKTINKFKDAKCDIINESMLWELVVYSNK